MKHVKTHKPPFASVRITRRAYLQVLVLAIALYVFVPQLDEFGHSLQLLPQIRLVWLLAAAGVLTVSFAAAAMVYQLLSTEKLRFFTTFLVQLASSFTNRLLPAGLGAMSLNERYLHRQGHKHSHAMAVITANQLLGFMSLCFLILLLAVFGRLPTGNFVAVHIEAWYIAAAVCAAAVLLTLLKVVSPKIRAAIISFLRENYRSIRFFLSRPGQFLGAFMWAMAITVCYATCLYLALRSCGVMLAYPKVLLVYIGGSAIGAVAPTPGGLGAVEAALVAGLTSFGIDSSQALLVTLAYRLVTFWLPILPGYITFRYLLARQQL
jgi:undecaprenyl-diphosphatase